MLNQFSKGVIMDTMNWVFSKIKQQFGFEDKELSEREAAEYIGKSLSTLRSYRSNRDFKRIPDLPYHKKGRYVFYWRKDLKSFLDKTRGQSGFGGVN